MSKDTITREIIKVDGVNPKPNERFKTAGGLLIGDKWRNVMAGIDMTIFDRGGSYEVDTATNAKGYKTVVHVYNLEQEKKELPTQTAQKPVEEQKALPQKSFSLDRDLSMESSGLVQAAGIAVASAYPGLPLKDYVAKVEETAKALLDVKSNLCTFIKEKRS